ncbi:hypothetical protein C8R41DRAFT_925675 [Lentinula lateritia]|uniref:Uncharacterized protein n=1 Tax=Lentinula lateritia TaxID=40482 RepID=A0ABQ8V005_9AGAR|nr:hypothetical protein C8R41DRAFT_925675 [Lentinula lateritia]
MGIGTNQDEITLYLDSRYVSASEACWRLFHYELHQEKPNVVRLAVHNENGQYITFKPNDPRPVQDIAEAEGRKDSTLLGFFKVNKQEKCHASTIIHSPLNGDDQDSPSISHTPSPLRTDPRPYLPRSTPVPTQDSS